VRKNLPDAGYFIGKPVPNMPDTIIGGLVDSGNDGRVYKAHSAGLGRDVACKVIPRANLQLGPSGDKWKLEVHKADKLRSGIAVKFENIVEWVDPAAGIDCVLLVSDFVDGPSLRRFIVTDRNEVTVAFIVDWLRTMLDLFHEMSVRGITHGDLHLGNILVEDRSSYTLLGSRFAFRVTDFGVAEATSDRRHRDDYLQLADSLSQLLQLIDFQACDAKERFAFNVLRNDFLSRHLIEADPTRDPIARQPNLLMARLERLEADFAEFERAAAGAQTLVSPFDYLSCEQIGEASDLLHALYSDFFLGLPEIESQNNVIVTGPRGCGKSTVFRNLSLDQRMRVGNDRPEDIRYIGVYYRCDDLYFAFPRYVATEREAALDIPIHFVTAILLAKTLDLVEEWGHKYFENDFLGREGKISGQIWSALAMNPPSSPGAATFRSLISRLNKERLQAAERYRFTADVTRDLGSFFGPDALQRVCRILIDNLPFLNNRPIYFFIDDFSSPKVTRSLQHNLNRLFMQRTPVCFFKLSTESPVSFEKQDIDGKTYVESREYVVQNLGLVYLRADLKPKLTFIEDVFARRLRTSATNLSVEQLEQLVGANPRLNSNEFARSIRAGENPLHWGKETLCHLCSGDIHYLISLVSDMVRGSGGINAVSVSPESPRIKLEIQNRAIRDGAGTFLKNLRSVPKCGERLVNIVEAFGNVASSQLKFLESKNESGDPPKQASRIEPYEPFTLSPAAQELYDELLRYSVFLEDFRGKSRRGNVVPRLYLRRFLIPHFNLTFSKRDSIELESAAFEDFLLNPSGFDKRHRLKSSDDALRYEKKETDDQTQLGLGFEGPLQ
jgi:serine/threonine protein kinase